jgi:hypothetical protein
MPRTSFGESLMFDGMLLAKLIPVRWSIKDADLE